MWGKLDTNMDHKHDVNLTINILADVFTTLLWTATLVIITTSTLSSITFVCLLKYISRANSSLLSSDTRVCNETNATATKKEVSGPENKRGSATAKAEVSHTKENNSTRNDPSIPLRNLSKHPPPPASSGIPHQRHRLNSGKKCQTKTYAARSSKMLNLEYRRNFDEMHSRFPRQDEQRRVNVRWNDEVPPYSSEHSRRFLPEVHPDNPETRNYGWTRRFDCTDDVASLRAELHQHRLWIARLREELDLARAMYDFQSHQRHSTHPDVCRYDNEPVFYNFPSSPIPDPVPMDVDFMYSDRDHIMAPTSRTYRHPADSRRSYSSQRYQSEDEFSCDSYSSRLEREVETRRRHSKSATKSRKLKSDRVKTSSGRKYVTKQRKDNQTQTRPKPNYPIESDHERRRDRSRQRDQSKCTAVHQTIIEQPLYLEHTKRSRSSAPSHPRDSSSLSVDHTGKEDSECSELNCQICKPRHTKCPSGRPRRRDAASHPFDREVSSDCVEPHDKRQKRSPGRPSRHRDQSPHPNDCVVDEVILECTDPNCHICESCPLKYCSNCTAQNQATRSMKTQAPPPPEEGPPGPIIYSNRPLLATWPRLDDYGGPQRGCEKSNRMVQNDDVVWCLAASNPGETSPLIQHEPQCRYNQYQV